MDLVTHVTNVGPVVSFTPGATTPEPWNVSHVGLTDGTSPSSASRNMAEIYNRLLLDRAATIQAAGLVIDNSNWTQMAQAIQVIAQTPRASQFVQTTNVQTVTNGSYITLASMTVVKSGVVSIFLGYAGFAMSANVSFGCHIAKNLVNVMPYDDVTSQSTINRQINGYRSISGITVEAGDILTLRAAGSGATNVMSKSYAYIRIIYE